MKFQLFEGEQRTPEWFAARRGKPSSSQLHRWKAYDKRKKEPTLTKTAIDYERELMFERQFDKNFEHFTTDAMQDGIDYEAFARKEYERITGNLAVEVGGWYNDFFFASTDGRVTEKGKKKPNGILEIKWLYDKNFTEVLATRKPYVGTSGDHWKQCQGGLFASGLSFCDYVVGNLNTKKIIILRVKPDKEYHKELEASLQEPLMVEEFDMTGVYEFEEAVREDEMAIPANFNKSKSDSDLEGF